MKAFVYDKKADASRQPEGIKLTMREIDTPMPKSGEVLIEVRAVSVNAADYRSMQMGLIPKGGIFGAAIAGQVVALGPGTSEFVVGDAVACDSSGENFGGFAEYAAVSEAILARIPDGLSFETAAAVPLAAVTALQGLRKYKGDLRGRSVLINGAAGGVGSFAVQLAKFYGAEVTGVCGTANTGRVQSLGADRVIDYTKQPLETLVSSANSRYDLILGVQGNCGLGTYRRLLAPRGRYVMIGGSISQIFRSLLLGPLYSLGSRKLLSLAAKPSADDLKYVMSLVADGSIVPLIQKAYSFAELPEAVALASGGHAWGKLVIAVRP